MVEVSIIVAVYRAEKYIRRCLDSLRNQTLNCFEVVLVDDGSPDLSGVICDEYAAKDKRFSVIHKKNGGVSSARQTGLDNARGEFVIHVDPDDWVDPEMLESLVECARKNSSDVVICDMFEEGKNGQRYIEQKPSSLDTLEYCNDLISEKLHGSCCNKLVRRSCIIENNIKFQLNLVMREDELFNIHLAKLPLSISYLHKAFYHYDMTINEYSVVASVSEKKLNSLIFLIDWLEKHAVDESLLVERKKSAKFIAFMQKKMTTKSFRSFYPEINSHYVLKLKRFGHLDFFMAFALRFSQPLARILYTCKMKFL